MNGRTGSADTDIQGQREESRAPTSPVAAPSTEPSPWRYRTERAAGVRPVGLGRQLVQLSERDVDEPLMKLGSRKAWLLFSGVVLGAGAANHAFLLATSIPPESCSAPTIPVSCYIPSALLLAGLAAFFLTIAVICCDLYGFIARGRVRSSHP